MSRRPSVQDQEQTLARRISVLMRIGTLLAAVLLSAGAILGGVGAQPVSTALLVAGCTTLILARLLLMAGHFARADRLFLWVSVLVLALVIAGAAVGLLVHPT